ncbi:MAG: hypothetical protein WAV20_06305 [Blastocatellia bacterium]
MLTSPKNIYHKVAVSIACVLLFSLASPAEPEPVAAQGQARTLERSVLPFEPIEIMDVKLHGRSIRLNAALTGDNDWLQGLTFRVKNISGKPISYVSIQLRVNPPESGNLPRVTGLSAGFSPFSPNGISPRAETFVAPDDFGEIVLSDTAYNAYKHELQASTILVRVGLVVFTDDTAWSEGLLLKRDAKTPNRWVVVEESQKRLEETLKKQGWRRELKDIPRFSRLCIDRKPRKPHQPRSAAAGVMEL